MVGRHHRAGWCIAHLRRERRPTHTHLWEELASCVSTRRHYVRRGCLLIWRWPDLLLCWRGCPVFRWNLGMLYISVRHKEDVTMLRHIPDFQVKCCFFLILDLGELEARCLDLSERQHNLHISTRKLNEPGPLRCRAAISNRLCGGKRIEHILSSSAEAKVSNTFSSIVIEGKSL